jgi:hypothetical protein
MERYGIVYLITCTANNKKYVGQTTQDLQTRWSGHKSGATNCYLGADLKLYGEKCFDIEPLCECYSRKELNQKECDYMNQFNSFVSSGLGYNILGQRVVNQVENNIPIFVPPVITKPIKSIQPIITKPIKSVQPINMKNQLHNDDISLLFAPPIKEHRYHYRDGQKILYKIGPSKKKKHGDKCPFCYMNGKGLGDKTRPYKCCCGYDVIKDMEERYEIEKQQHLLNRGLLFHDFNPPV